MLIPGEASEPTYEIDTQCLSAQDLQHPEELFVPEDDVCREREAKAAKGEIAARMICKLPNYSESEFVFEAHGTYDSESAELTGQSNLGDATLHETRSFKRQGDC